MRRLLLAAAVAAIAVLPAGGAAATHSCAEGFELVCFAGCPKPPEVCPWP